jgi:methylmalonyl-CoA mutase cobalamin-binding subunit
VLCLAAIAALLSILPLVGLSSRSRVEPSWQLEEVRETGQGKLLVAKLPSAPFPHEARKAGYVYDGDSYPYESHYSDSSVAVFIPKNLKPAASTNMVFFFHGWFSSVDDATSRFSLTEQFAASGTNAVLVIPETARDSPDSFGGKLEEKGGFARLSKDLLALLSSRGYLPTASIGKIVIAGHSGAYRVMARILELGGLSRKIAEVEVFDGLYSDVDTFYSWIVAGSGKFVSVYSDDGGTRDNARALIESLKASGLEVAAARDDPELDEGVLGYRLVFLESAYDHFGLVSLGGEFRRILASSPALSR